MPDTSIVYMLFQLGLGGSSVFLFMTGMTMLAVLVFMILLLTEAYQLTKE